MAIHTHARGAAAVSIIAGLVVISLVIVGAVVLSASDADASVGRSDALRAFYAADGGMNMAVRELMLSTVFRAEEMSSTHRSAPLSEPTRCLESFTFRAGQLALVRALAESRASQFGLSERQLDDLVLAVHEIAANSVRHGGGQGEFRLWRDGRSLVAEISDRGTIDDPLAGRRQPGASSERGRGLWIANQVCDLVQIRTYPTGSVVRLFVSLDPV